MNRSSLPQDSARAASAVVVAESVRDPAPGKSRIGVRSHTKSSIPHNSAKTRGPLAFRLLAVSAVAAGGLGVVLPLVPTTPFLLLALWAASKGSPELHERIRTDPRFGPTLEAWQRDRAVPLKAKLLALLLMASSWLMLWLTGTGAGVLLAVGLLLLGVATFLLTRPTAGSRS